MTTLQEDLESLRADANVILDMRVPDTVDGPVEPAEDTTFAVVFNTITKPPPPPCERANSIDLKRVRGSGYKEEVY